MTYRASFVTEQHRLQTARPVPTLCACSLPARHEAAPTQERTDLPRSSTGFATVSAIWLAISRSPDASVAPNVHAHSP
jgi:hypothetical protein